jgi:hypothetical protein
MKTWVKTLFGIIYAIAFAPRSELTCIRALSLGRRLAEQADSSNPRLPNLETVLEAGPVAECAHWHCNVCLQRLVIHG